MIRRPPRSTQSRSSAASDVYKRQGSEGSDFVSAVSGLDSLVCELAFLSMIAVKRSALRRPSAFSTFNFFATVRNSATSISLRFSLSCLLYTSPSPRDRTRSRMPSSA
eukprot:TRINITY_DN19974_c0_g1_i1.p1 TRINITY_DN19974_c0_g1~~TRINITY_DN19974_c0_g1_i1.p1  ORF type:complete len:108 (+),score=32.28 TRINITY_DN19974_c0_g1_i1:114-437(+)